MHYFSVLLLLLSNALLAENFGSIGTTFPIAEEDMLVMIEAKLKAKDMQVKIQNLQAQFKQQALNSAKRPRPVNLPQAEQTRIYSFDPSTYLPHDLIDPQGQLFYKASTKVNPLDYFSLPRPLVLIDGDDQQQLAFALDYEQQHKTPIDLILVKGAPFLLMETLKRPVFFDQGGSIVKHFNIKHVPVTIMQQAKQLIITEHKL